MHNYVHLTCVKKHTLHYVQTLFYSFKTLNQSRYLHLGSWRYRREAVSPSNAADQGSQIEGLDLLIRKALKVARVVMDSFYASFSFLI